MSARIVLISEDPAFSARVQTELSRASLSTDVYSPSETPVEIPQLILVDLAPSDVRALTALERLRARPETSRTPAILIGTGRERVRSSMDALRHRADEYVQRPVTMELLLGLMARLLNIPPPLSPDPEVVLPGTDPARHQDVVNASLKMLTPSDGAFADGEFAALLWACHMQSVSGRLDLFGDGQDVDRSIFLREGRVVSLRSRRTEDRLEEFLFQRGFLTRSQSTDARARNLTSPRRLAAALAEDGLLKVREVIDVTREHLKDRVVALLELREGRFQFIADAATESEIVVLDERPEVLLWRGIHRKLPIQRLMSVVGGPATLIQPEGRADLSRFALKDDALAVAALIDGTRTLEDLSRTRDAELCWQVAFLLITVGAARVAARGLDVGPTDGPSRARELQIDRARLAELHRRAQESSYFDLLGLPVSATRTEIQEALTALRQTVGRARQAAQIHHDLLPLVSGMEPVVEECSEVLLDERLRERYRAAFQAVPSAG